MAIYCVGDLHGRFDLFQMLLTKINFDPQKDKLYVLGDVIDWNYGGIKILDYLIAHQDSCCLIEGNHEAQFIHMVNAYDIIMLNHNIKEIMVTVADVYSEKLFQPIAETFLERFAKAKKPHFYSHPQIKHWLKDGDLRVRQRLLDTMVQLAECINYDVKIYQKIMWVLSNFQGQYKTKKFVQELLEQPPEKYISIKEYLTQIPHHLEFEYNNTHFYLCHWKGNVNRNVSYKIETPHGSTHNVTYIFGHDPVPSLHAKIQTNINSFDFDYRRIFSWIDTNQNRYYWMDLGSNPIAAIRLDDMSEYYTGLPSTRKNAKPWTVNANIFPAPERSHRSVPSARIGGVYFSKSAIVTLDRGCYEFLIGIGKNKRIYYTHIGWLEYQYAFIIEDWLGTQSIEQIIDKVRQDFMEQQSLAEHKFAYDYLHGLA